MQNNYIARLQDGRLVSIYFESSALRYRKWENGRWLKEQLLLENAQPDFTVNFGSKNELRIFAQENNGCIVLVSFDGENLVRRTILENKSTQVHTILFHSLESENAMSLLYNIPGDENKQKLMTQSLNENASWGESKEIAVFLPLPGQLYELQRITPTHALAFFRSENNIVGYKEITPGKVSEFVPIQRYAENMQNFSFLTTTQGLHTLYVSPAMFSSKLVYRRKIAESFDTPIILWEGQSLENCLLAEIAGILYAFFQISGALYMMKSSDNGASFSRPELYKYKFCRSPVKAGYISASDNGDYILRNIFTDSQCPWDIQIMPELCEEFFIYNENKEESPVEPDTPHRITHSVRENTELITNEDTSRMELLIERMERLSAENRDYRTKLAELTHKLTEKETENLQYSTAVEEISLKDKLLEDLNRKTTKLQTDYNKQKSSISKYLKQINKLEKENNQLKASQGNIGEKVEKQKKNIKSSSKVPHEAKPLTTPDVDNVSTGK